MATPPKIYPRSEHMISRSLISDNALKVLYRLKKSGFQAYLVGAACGTCCSVASLRTSTW